MTAELTNVRVGEESCVVVGVGNPILSDDAVGLTVLRLLQDHLADRRNVTFIQAPVAGFELAEMLIGYSRAVIIDAVQTKQGPPGTCHSYDWMPAAAIDWPAALHRVGIMDGLALAHTLGLAAPKRVRIYAVEVVDLCTFSVEMTEPVADAVPAIVEQILLREFGRTVSCLAAADETGTHRYQSHQ